MADITYNTDAPAQGLISGFTGGLNAGTLIAHEKHLQTAEDAAKKAAAAEEAKTKMTSALELTKQSWVPDDYKMMLYNQNIKPYFSNTTIQLPELKSWPDYGTEASKKLHDIITKGHEQGLPAQEIETMAAMALMPYDKEHREAGKPVLESLRNQADLQNKIDVEKAKAGAKYDAGTTKRLTDLGKNLDPAAFRTGEFGKTFSVQQRAERLQTLGNAFASGNLDSRQIEELAIGLNSMLAGGNVAAQSQTEALVPKTIVGNASKLAEWLTNTPTGTNQVAFVKRLMGTVEREKQTAISQLKRAKYQKIAPFEDLGQIAPEKFNNILASSGVQPAEYQQWVAAGRPAIDVVQKTEDAAPIYSQTATDPKTGKKVGWDKDAKKWLEIK